MISDISPSFIMSSKELYLASEDPVMSPPECCSDIKWAIQEPNLRSFACQANVLTNRACRISVGPQRGRKVYMMQELPKIEEPFGGEAGRVAATNEPWQGSV